MNSMLSTHELAELIKIEIAAHALDVVASLGVEDSLQIGFITAT